jgi:hypothetical protein
MSEAVAPAAPVAATSSNPAPGKATAPAPVVETKPGPNGTRAPDGRFLPKEGTQGVAPKEAPQQPGETKEAYRLRTKVKVYGEERDVDLDEDGIKRELQLGYATKRQLSDALAKLKAREEADKLADENPEEFLRRKGRDLDEMAKRQLLAAIEQAAMSPEQRELAELRAQLEAQQTEKAQREEKEKGALKALHRKKFIEQRKQVYRAAMPTTGLEPTHETLYLMAETEDLMRQDGIEVTPESLASEVRRRVSGFTRNYLTALSPEALSRELGTETIQALLKHSIEQFERSQGVVRTQKEAVPPMPREERPRYLSVQEVEANLKKMFGT